MNGTVYQLSIKPSEPFSPAYTVLRMDEKTAIFAKYPDVALRANLSERVGMWFVWQYRQHDWVGFTSGNQLRKCGVVFQSGDIEKKLLTSDSVVWGWVDLDKHHPGWTVAAQAEHCHPGFSKAATLIGLHVPRLTAGAYCNYFAMRWELFDKFMQWSERFIERIVANADDPILGRRIISEGMIGKDRHTVLGAIQERLFVIWLGTSGLSICRE